MALGRSWMGGLFLSVSKRCNGEAIGSSFVPKSIFFETLSQRQNTLADLPTIHPFSRLRLDWPGNESSRVRLWVTSVPAGSA